MDDFEKNIKNQLNMTLSDKEISKDFKSRLFIKLGIKKHTNFNLHRILKLSVSFSLLVLIFICSIIIFSPDDEIANYKAIIEINVNPSIELVIENDKVVSTKGLNDNGKLILIDENFENKNLDDVLNDIIYLEFETNYINENNRDVNILVTTENIDNAESLQDKLETIFIGIENNLQLDLDLELQSGKDINQLKDYILSFEPSISSEDLNDLSFDSLVERIQKYHNEVKNLYSIDLEEKYLQSKKDYIINYIDAKQYELINKLDDSYKDKITLYDKIYNDIEEGIINLEKEYNRLFVDADSDYISALDNLKNKEKEIETKKDELKILEENGNTLEYIKANIELEALNKEYEILNGGFTLIKEEADKIYNSLRNILENNKIKLEEIKKEFPTSILNIKFSDFNDVFEENSQYINKLYNDFISTKKEIIENTYKEIVNKKSNLKND